MCCYKKFVGVCKTNYCFNNSLRSYSTVFNNILCLKLIFPFKHFLGYWRTFRKASKLWSIISMSALMLSWSWNMSLSLSDLSIISCRATVCIQNILSLVTNSSLWCTTNYYPVVFFVANKVAPWALTFWGLLMGISVASIITMFC